MDVIILISDQSLRMSHAYGKILYNNIKEYTPKWFPTIPYSQTVKPTFGRRPQVVSKFNSNPAVKQGYKIFANVFQRHSFMWQVLILGMSIGCYYFIYTPFLAVYRANNKHRTLAAAMVKEKAHKKKLREIEEAEEAAEAAAEAAEAAEE